ncbi:MAG: pyrroline-5-carboxylate reductase [Armatimonadota bacterium]|nr:pyrroline-5-carboxylate reductase [bacterium]
MESDRIGRLAIIGAGAMGSAFAKGVISAGLLSPEDVTMADVYKPRLGELADEFGVNVTQSPAEAMAGADVVLFAVKPAVLLDILPELSDAVREGQLIISIAAGVRLEAIESALPRGAAVIRTMPNTPCQIGMGAIGFSRGRSVSDDQVSMAKRLFDAVGLSFEVPEKLLNAVTGLSGSGPAYVYIMIEALSDAGVRVGLPRNAALALAAQTVLGSAKMVLETGEHPMKLKDQVTSPGGTTIAGVDALDRHGFRTALMEAVKAATKRSEELA